MWALARAARGTGERQVAPIPNFKLALLASWPRQEAKTTGKEAPSRAKQGTG